MKIYFHCLSRGPAFSPPSHGAARCLPCFNRRPRKQRTNSLFFSSYRITCHERVSARLPVLPGLPLPRPRAQKPSAIGPLILQFYYHLSTLAMWREQPSPPAFRPTISFSNFMHPTRHGAQMRCSNTSPLQSFPLRAHALKLQQKALLLPVILRRVLLQAPQLGLEHHCIHSDKGVQQVCSHCSSTQRQCLSATSMSDDSGRTTTTARIQLLQPFR